MGAPLAPENIIKRVPNLHNTSQQVYGKYIKCNIRNSWVCVVVVVACAVAVAVAVVVVVVLVVTGGL